MINTSPKWTVEQLQAFRSQSDPVADAVIDDIFSRGDQAAVRALFDQLVHNQDIPPAGFDPIVAQYFKETAHFPSYADPALIREGEAVFAKYGMFASMVLFCKSLPECYTGRRGAQVLFATGRLGSKDPRALARRLMETAQFVIDVLSPGGLSPAGKGVRSAQKVRLIHASIRHFLKQRGWDSEDLGEPLNQEDKAGTLMAFSALLLDGFRLMHIELTPREQEAYFHCWRVVGHIMGVDPALIPANYAEGEQLGQMIIHHQAEPSPEGKELAAAAIQFMESMAGGPLFHHVPEALTRFFIGDRYADMLGLASHEDLMSNLAPRMTKLIGRTVSLTEERHPVFRELAKSFNLTLLKAQVAHFNNHKAIHFYIPPSLRGDWKIPVEWVDKWSLPLFNWRLAVQKKRTEL